jgi:hypothetical protein
VQRTPLFRKTVKRIGPLATFVALGHPEQSLECSVELVTGSGTTMNKALITFSILTSLCVAAAVTSFASLVNAQENSQENFQENTQEIGTQKADPPLASPVQEDCSSQVWPNFSQSCLRGRDIQVTVRNVSVRTPERR